MDQIIVSSSKMVCLFVQCFFVVVAAVCCYYCYCCRFFSHFRSDVHWYKTRDVLFGYFRDDQNESSMKTLLFFSPDKSNSLQLSCVQTWQLLIYLKLFVPKPISALLVWLYRRIFHLFADCWTTNKQTNKQQQQNHRNI